MADLELPECKLMTKFQGQGNIAARHDLHEAVMLFFTLDAELRDSSAHGFKAEYPDVFYKSVVFTSFYAGTEQHLEAAYDPDDFETHIFIQVLGMIGVCRGKLRERDLLKFCKENPDAIRQLEIFLDSTPWGESHFYLIPNVPMLIELGLIKQGSYSIPISPKWDALTEFGNDVFRFIQQGKW